MDYSNIRKEIKERKFLFDDFAKSIGLTPPGLRKALRKKTLRIDHLEKISEAFGVKMTYWFQDEDLVMHENVTYYQDNSNDEIKKLNRIIEELRDDKKRMKEQIDELKADKIAMRSDFDLILAKHGISKVGT